MKRLLAFAVVVVSSWSLADGLPLPLVGLTVDLPADSSVSKMLGSQMVQGGGTAISVKEQKAGPSEDKDLAAAKKSAAM